MVSSYEVAFSNQKNIKKLFPFILFVFVPWRDIAISARWTTDDGRRTTVVHVVHVVHHLENLENLENQGFQGGRPWTTVDDPSSTWKTLKTKVFIIADDASSASSVVRVVRVVLFSGGISNVPPISLIISHSYQ